MKKEKYKHLTYDDRMKIETLYAAHLKPLEIAAQIGCSKATIYRELKRGHYMRYDSKRIKDVDSYSATIAQDDYDYKATAKGATFKLADDYELADFLRGVIVNQRYSVDAALYAASAHDFKTHISRTTLYRYLDDDIIPGLSNANLVSGKRKKTTSAGERKHKPHGRSIVERDPEINKRSDFGHWEMDTVVGKRDGVSCCLLVLTERRTRSELCVKMPAKTIVSTEQSLAYLHTVLKDSYNDIIKTITVDNGVEFNSQQVIESYGVTAYYCHPYTSCERGSNENQNRFIRRWLPKGQSMETVTQEQATWIQHWMNHYPRKMFGGKSSFDKLKEELDKLNLPNEDEILKFFG